MDKEILIVLIRGLVARPEMFSFIEEDLADWLEDHGYFDLVAHRVSDRALSFLTTSQ